MDIRLLCVALIVLPSAVLAQEPAPKTFTLTLTTDEIIYLGSLQDEALKVEATDRRKLVFNLNLFNKIQQQIASQNAAGSKSAFDAAVSAEAARRTAPQPDKPQE